MRLQLVLLSLALMAVSALPAGARELTRAESDSVVNALATIWSDYVKSKALRADDTKAQAEYMRGLSEALNLADKPDAYYQGLQDGVVIDSRVKNVEQMGTFKVNREALARAFERAMRGRLRQYSKETADRYMNYIITAASVDVAVEEDSKAFLDSVSKVDGMKHTVNGLYYQIIKKGDGLQPPFRQCEVVVDYTGRLYDGTVFDTTEGKKPQRFRLDQVIPGFAEGLYLMPKGSTYRLFIPSEIGYGDRGVTGVIPPKAALQFDVTLLDIIPADGSNK